MLKQVLKLGTFLVVLLGWLKGKTGRYSQPRQALCDEDLVGVFLSESL